MGMALALHTISDSNIAKSLSDPPLIWRIIAPDEPEMYEAARTEAKQSFLSRLLGKTSEKPRIEVHDIDLAVGEGAESDVDKAWHGIHYLLTGTAWEGERPLDFLVNGGTQVGDIDVGYGPARVFRSEEVLEICEMISNIDASTLRSRFNPEEMTALEIYPEIWGRDPTDDDTLEYCVKNYVELKHFLENARSNKLGLALCLC